MIILSTSPLPSLFYHDQSHCHLLLLLRHHHHFCHQNSVVLLMLVLVLQPKRPHTLLFEYTLILCKFSNRPASCPLLPVQRVNLLIRLFSCSCMNDINSNNDKNDRYPFHQQIFLLPFFDTFFDFDFHVTLLFVNIVIRFEGAIEIENPEKNTYCTMFNVFLALPCNWCRSDEILFPPSLSIYSISIPSLHHQRTHSDRGRIRKSV